MKNDKKVKTKLKEKNNIIYIILKTDSNITNKEELFDKLNSLLTNYYVSKEEALQDLDRNYINNFILEVDIKNIFSDRVVREVNLVNITKEIL